MSEIPSARATYETTPEREKISWRARLDSFRERPFGRLTTAVAIVLALSADQKAEAFNNEPQVTNTISIASENGSDIQLRLGDAEQALTLGLTDWDTAASLPQANEPYIKPNPTLEKLIATEDPFMEEIGLIPGEIENPEAFNAWVRQQASRPDLLEALNIQDDQSLTPHQLVNLSATIVMSNVDYNTNHFEPEDISLEELEKEYNYHLPLDTILIEHKLIQCEGYAATTKAVFGELKKIYPQELKNTYMTTQSGILEGHVWDLIVQVEAENQAQVALIDATADDPSYDNTEPEVKFGIMEITEGLYEKHVIDASTLRSLMAQYEAKQPLTDAEREEYEVDKELYIK